jgi:hypothetical protein
MSRVNFAEGVKDDSSSSDSDDQERGVNSMSFGTLTFLSSLTEVHHQHTTHTHNQTRKGKSSSLLTSEIMTPFLR